jgi:hypothetical protein
MKEGGEMPSDGRQLSTWAFRERKSWHSADSFMLHLYEMTAEHLAETDCTEDLQFEKDIDADGVDDYKGEEFKHDKSRPPDVLDVIGRLTSEATLPVKWLPNMSTVQD